MPRYEVKQGETVLVWGRVPGGTVGDCMASASAALERLRKHGDDLVDPAFMVTVTVFNKRDLPADADRVCEEVSFYVEGQKR